MPALTIPTGQDPFYIQRTDLDGQEYVLSFEWSSRESCWYLSVADSEENVIASGIKLVCNVFLLNRLADDRKPPGLLFVKSFTTDKSPPQLQDLANGRCELIYITADSV